MSTTIVSTVMGAALLAASTIAAGAADLGGPGSIKDSYMPMESPMTWYVRADLGWAAHDKPVMTEAFIFDLTNTSYDDTWTAGGGIGRYFGRYVRADITYDHRFESDVSATKSSPAAADFPGKRTFGLQSDVVLFNVYYDFAGRGHFTPYIGVGLGFVRHETTSGSVPDGGCGPCAFTNVTSESATNWQTAGALMAGFAFKIHSRFYLDAGYRFLYLGETRTGNFTGIAFGNAITSGPASVEDIHAHEFRVGLRLDIR